MRASEVERVFRSGRASHGRTMVVFSAPGRGGVAFVASRKVGGAVERNRAKRILRSAWTAAAGASREDDVVLVAREGIRGAKAQDLVAEMIKLLNAGRRA